MIKNVCSPAVKITYPKFCWYDRSICYGTTAAAGSMILRNFASRHQTITVAKQTKRSCFSMTSPHSVHSDW